MNNKICIVELYKEYFKNQKDLISLLEEKGNTVFTYSFFNVQTEYFSSKVKLLFQEIVCFFKLIFNIGKFRNKKILCLGGHFSFLLINKLFGWVLGPSYHLYVYNFYLHAMGEKKIVKLILRYLLTSSKITLIVQSPGEVTFYKELSKKSRILFSPYCEDLNYDKINEFKLEDGREYIFTGGYTNRDYPLMLECAKKFPSVQFIFVISSFNDDDLKTGIPDNVIIHRDLERDLFYSIMKGASSVIVPLKHNVGASGQMLCLGAMALSKAIIYTNVSSINYYFKTDKLSGIAYEIGNSESLSSALNTLIAMGSDERIEMGRNASENYLFNYTKKNRNSFLCSTLTK